MKLYLAGPMRGIPQYNFPLFDAAKWSLESQGHEVISPADHDREVDPNYDHRPDFAEGVGFRSDDPEFHALMGWDLMVVATPVVLGGVEGIALLPGWSKSSGAAHELYVAEAAGKLVVYVWPVANVHGDVTGYMLMSMPMLEDTINLVPSPPSSGTEMVVDPDTGGVKGRKLARFDLIPPGPLKALAEHYGRGSLKYEDRNWEKGYAWGLSFGAMMRHANAWHAGEDIDPEGFEHLAAVAWHAFALLEFTRTHPEKDDRPTRTLVST